MHFAEPIDRAIKSYEALSQLTELLDLYWTASGRTPSEDRLYWKYLSEGPGKNWRTFRQHLLGIHTSGFNYRKYVGPYLNEAPVGHLQKDFEEILAGARVGSWTLNSRRVYRVPGDLQLLLSATSLEGVNWTKVRWPFESFLLSLEYPITLGDKRYDSILVCDEFQTSPNLGDYKTILLISTKGYDAGRIFRGENSPERFMRAVEMRNFDHVQNRIISIASSEMNDSDLYRIVRLSNTCFSDLSVLQGTEKYSWEEPNWQVALRVLFGLLFYMQSAPPQKLQTDMWERSIYRRKDGPVRTVSLASQICQIHSLYRLNDYERRELSKLLTGGISALEVLHRTGHWRRPPGEGQNPFYPPTVWVRPTIVRRDKLQVGHLPLGSEQIIS